MGRPFSNTLNALQSDCSRLYLHVEAPSGYSLQLTVHARHLLTSAVSAACTDRYRHGHFSVRMYQS